MKIIKVTFLKQVENTEFVQVIFKEWFVAQRKIAFKEIGAPFWRWLDTSEFADELDSYYQRKKQTESTTKAKQLFYQS